MTTYAIDEARGELVAVWGTGFGDVATTVSSIGDGGNGRPLPLARELSRLSAALWRCYTHPASAAASVELNTEGWRRQEARDGFAAVPGAIRRPNLPDEHGYLRVSYDPVNEYSHRVGRVLHDLNNPLLTEAVAADVEAEIAAIERAELGDLSGRASQAVLLTRQDASPVQVAAADDILAKNPLGGDQLLTLDPTAACVAAAHWLYAAATVVSDITGTSVAGVILEADDIEALPVSTPVRVLKLIDAGKSPTDAVIKLIGEAMAVAEGHATDFRPLRRKARKAKTLFERSDVQGTEYEAEARRVQLTTLDPRRPGPDMLEDLLTGIHGCRLVYGSYADRIDTDVDQEADQATFEEAEGEYEEMEDDLDTDFANEVAAEANANRHRIGLAPEPTWRPDNTGIFLDLEADDICERLAGAVLTAGQPDIPRELIRAVIELDHDDSARLAGLVLARGTHCLISLRDAQLPRHVLETAIDWIDAEYGSEYSGPTAVVAALAGHSDGRHLLTDSISQSTTFRQLAEYLDADLFPSMIWLCVGLVATVGNRDSHWLRPYR